MTYKFSLQMKRDTAAQWGSSAYIPLEGEPCYDSTNVIFKIGNGVDKFKDLPAINGVFEGGTGEASELEKVTENGQTGWRLLGRDPANYGDIGDNAVDLSHSSYASTTMGASGYAAHAEGRSTTASGYASHAEG